MALDAKDQEEFMDHMIISVDYARYAAEGVQMDCTRTQRRELRQLIDDFEACVQQWLADVVTAEGN